MRTLGLLGITLILASCSTKSPFTAETEKQDKIMKHMAQGKTYVGGEFEGKFNTSGSDGFLVRAIGRSVYPTTQSEQLARASAVSDSKFKLTQTAPSEFKAIVQKAIGNSLGQTGDFTQIETSITEVKGVRNIDVKEEDVACKIVMEPNISGSYDNFRECRAIATVSLVELNKAYDFTMSAKYGDKSKSAVEKILEEQLRKQAMN
jgi:hypothetical protein